MTTKSPRVVLRENNSLSLDETKQIYDETGVLIWDDWMDEFHSDHAKLLFHVYGPNVIIPGDVEGIASHAFDGLPITSIKMPSSVIWIGDFAFSNTKLTEVDLSNVVQIFKGAFQNSALTSVEISTKIEHLESNAFIGNDLQSVVAPSTQTARANRGSTEWEIPFCYKLDESFDNNTVLILDGIITRDIAEQLVGRSGSNLIIPEGVVGIDANAFAGMSVEKIILPDSLKTIGHSAFAGTQISEVAIPNSVVDIGEGAFAGTPLVSVDIGEGVRSIGDYAFAGTQITNIELPGSLESIGEGAFTGTSLENIEVPENVIEVGSNAFPDTTNPEPALVNPVEMDAPQADSDQGTSEPVLPDPVTEVDDTPIISEPVLPEPVFEVYDPLTGSEPIQFEGVLEPFDSLTNPNQVFVGTVSEFIERDPFALSGSAGTVIEPIDGLQGSSTDMSAEFSEEQLQADLVNSMAAPSEVLA